MAVQRLPQCLQTSPAIIRRSFHSSVRLFAKQKPQFDFGPDGPPLNDAKARGIRTTRYRLPYLSNLKKLDAVFDDPYDIARSTIARRAKPGDPTVIIDPDGLYEEDDQDGRLDEDEFEDLPKQFQPKDQLLMERSSVDQLVEATGLTEMQVKATSFRSIITKSVVNQTRNGKIRSVVAMYIAGNKDGLIGMGSGKSTVGNTSNRKGLMRAMKAMRPIERYENRTVYGTIRGKYGATIVELRPRPPGFGVRANYYVHETCVLAGLKDVSGQVFGSKNGMNIIKAVLEALKTQKVPSMIAKERGKHVIDVRQRLFHSMGT